jgi:hypothetical protein
MSNKDNQKSWRKVTDGGSGIIKANSSNVERGMSGLAGANKSGSKPASGQQSSDASKKQ